MKLSMLTAMTLLAGCTGADLDVQVASRSAELSVAAPAGRVELASRPLLREWPADLGRVDSPTIVGGTPHTGNPEVAIIAMLDAQGSIIGICSGTLIQPRLVLTAAHCVDGQVPAAGYAVYFGTDIVADDDPGFVFLTEAVSVVFHPDWNPDDLLAGNDIGLVHLADDVPITPAPFRTAPLSAAELGAPVHLVGWGITGGGLEDSGIKRHVVSRLDEFDDKLVLVGNSETNTCSGDSGGPAFLTVGGVEQVVGVTSFGDENCAENGVSTRVDVFVDFIAANSDPDGPGPGAGGLGAPCDDGSACQSGICVTGGGPGFCSAECSAAAPCPGGFDCAQLDAATQVCVPGGQLGDACQTAAECESGLCATAADGSGICTESCESRFDCGAGFACEAVEGGSVCLPDELGSGFPTPIASEDEGGCSAAAGGSGALSALLPLLGLALLRRRRIRQSCPDR
jgi:MYXO-CTERM domain-containing protein